MIRLVVSLDNKTGSSASSSKSPVLSGPSTANRHVLNLGRRDFICTESLFRNILTIYDKSRLVQGVNLELE